MSFQTVLLLSFLVALLFLQVTLACFVTNCPPGGKRSAMSFAPSYKRQCMACGPDGKGRCFGQNICCGDSFGCLLSTEESAVCRKENYSRILCQNRGLPCGINDKGICAADGICCTEKGCSVESKCVIQAAAIISSLNFS